MVSAQGFFGTMIGKATSLKEGLSNLYGSRPNWRAHTPVEVRLAIAPLGGVTFTEIENASKQIVDSAKGLQIKILVEGLGVAEAARHFAPSD